MHKPKLPSIRGIQAFSDFSELFAFWSWTIKHNVYLVQKKKTQAFGAQFILDLQGGESISEQPMYFISRIEVHLKHLQKCLGSSNTELYPGRDDRSRFCWWLEKFFIIASTLCNAAGSKTAPEHDPTTPSWGSSAFLCGYGLCDPNISILRRSEPFLQNAFSLNKLEAVDFYFLGQEPFSPLWYKTHMVVVVSVPAASDSRQAPNSSQIWVTFWRVLCCAQRSSWLWSIMISNRMLRSLGFGK